MKGPPPLSPVTDLSLSIFVAQWPAGPHHPWNFMDRIVDPNHIEPLLNIFSIGDIFDWVRPHLKHAVLASPRCTPLEIEGQMLFRGWSNDDKHKKIFYDYLAQPELVQFRERVLLRAYPHEHAASLCAAIVLVTDGYHVVKKSHIRSGRRRKTTAIKQFFRIAKALPFDLQAILCNRRFGLLGDFIPTRLLDLALGMFLTY
jgi:hypothetical protein